MKNSDILFKDNSTWNTLVPSALAQRLSLCPSEAGHFYAIPGYSVSRDFHNSFLLLYTVSGLGMVETEEKFMLSPGEAAIIDCHKPHSYRIFSDSWEFLWMHFSGSMAATYYELLRQNIAGAFSVKDKETIVSDFNEIVGNINAGDTISLMKCDKILTEMLFLLYSETTGPADRPQTDNIVRHVAEYIDAHFEKEIKVSELSKIFGISEYHLIRCFKRQMGTTPYNYLTNRRIAEAKRRLVLSELPVADIAGDCGFSDSAGFIACFKDRTGRTPLQYRKEFRS